MKKTRLESNLVFIEKNNNNGVENEAYRDLAKTLQINEVMAPCNKKFLVCQFLLVFEFLKFMGMLQKFIFSCDSVQFSFI